MKINHPSFLTTILTCLACLLIVLMEVQAAPGLPNITNFGTGSDKTQVMADRAEYELDSGWVTFSGNVAIRYQDMELRAGRIRYNNKTGEAQAKEGVVLVGNDGSLWHGDELEINIKKESGIAKGIDIFSSPFRVLADRGSITEDKTYFIDNAVVTTCTNAPGHFHFQLKTKRLRVRPDNDLTAWGAVPSLFGVPFFYFPYYWKDLSRHYGLRFEPGYQSSWGPYLLSSYKFPIVWNKITKTFIDSKTSVDYRGDRGVAYGEKISWIFNDAAKGWFSAYYLNDDDPPQAIEDPERYRLRLNHSWNITDRDQVLLQGLYVSDDLFMKNFFEDEYRTMNQPDNYASYTHVEDQYSYGLLSRMRLNDFYTQVERLPEAWFNLNSIELGESGIYIENATAASSLNKEFDERFDPLPATYDVFRVDSDTKVARPFKAFGFLNVVPRAGYRATYYSKTLDKIVSTSSESVVSTNAYGDVETFDQTTSETQEIEADADIRSVFELGTEISFKSYGLWQDTPGNIWRHVVEPYSDYTYIPEPNLVPSQLYQFDEVDEIDRTNKLRLGVRNRWQIKPVGLMQTSERIYVDLYTDINMDPQEDENTIDFLYLDTKYRPNSWLRFDFDTVYDIDLSEVNSSSLRLVAWHQVFSTDFEYRYRVDESSLLLGSLTWHVNSEWSVNAFGRYEFETTQVEEIGSWIQRKYDCIAFRFYASITPGYINAQGYGEEDDYRFSLLVWLTDFTPDRLRERDSR